MKKKGFTLIELLAVTELSTQKNYDNSTYTTIEEKQDFNYQNRYLPYKNNF